MIGVAISTTGDEHRLGFLETAVQRWQAALDREDLWDSFGLGVTVDGDEEAVERVLARVPSGIPVARVGQRPGVGNPFGPEGGRLGVAVNKNTGIEMLMDTEVEHLFLSDDDTHPLSTDSLLLHTSRERPAHSMVCWGMSRVGRTSQFHTAWSWPRGAVIYTHADAIEAVGGMREEFGPGGHEHVEWSRRIHASGWTPALFPSPPEYGADRGMGARAHWHAEDMRRPNESVVAHQNRRRTLTSVRRKEGDWEKIDALMRETEGSTDFVPYTAAENGRTPATLYYTND